MSEETPKYGDRRAPTSKPSYCQVHGVAPKGVCACDFENIGRALMDTIARNLPGYSWSECPSEVVVDLINQRDDARAAHEQPADLWGDGTREMLIELRDWLKSQTPCAVGPCCKDLRGWIEKVDQHITRHAPRASEPPASGPYTIEPHGDGYALYSGRDSTHHGFNLANITEATPETLQLIQDALNAQQLRARPPHLQVHHLSDLQLRDLIVAYGRQNNPTPLFWDAVLACLRELQELRASVWRPIPVTERLPTHIYSVLGFVVSPSELVCGEPFWETVVWNGKRGKWQCGGYGDDDIDVEVTHWVDLPGPPASPSGEQS